MKKFSRYAVWGLIVGLVVVAANFSQLALAQKTTDQSIEPFLDVSKEAGITATHHGDWNQFKPNFTHGYLGIGQAWGDYDKDGWPDLYVTGNLDKSVLYHNNRDGTFSVSAFSDSVSLPGAKTGGAVWADYDNDGWPDLYVVTDGTGVLFHNDQGRGFTNVTDKAGLNHQGKGSSATWGDYDKDGYLDLYVGNWSCYPECGEPGLKQNELAQDVLYHNNRDGTFSDVSRLLNPHKKLLGAAFAVSFVDYNNDGWPDIYVTNDMFKNPIGNVLWRNDGPGCGGWCWTDASAEAKADVVTNGMGLAIGDYKNDGNLDFYVTNMIDKMTLLQNRGNGTFVDATSHSGAGIGYGGVVGWGTAFFDYNNDGWLDLLVEATEFVQPPYRGEGGLLVPPTTLLGPHQSFLFKNWGDGTFGDVTPVSWRQKPQPSMGLAYADYNNDGWVDFVVGRWNQGYVLYRNTAAGSENNHWITVRLVGGGPINRDAVGARAYLTTMNGLTQLQAVISGSSLGAGNELALHFGLKDASIKQLRIVWPDGTEKKFKDIPRDKILTITYPDNLQVVSPQELLK